MKNTGGKSKDHVLHQKAEEKFKENESERTKPSALAKSKLKHDQEIPEVQQTLHKDEIANSAYSGWQSEEHFRSFIEDSEAVILFVDPATARIVFANDAAVKFYGWSREELLQKTVHAINTLPPNEIKRKMAEAIKDKQNYFVFQHRLATGAIRDVEVFQSKLNLENRVVLSLIVHDITERRHAEEEVRSREKELQMILDSAADAIFLADFDTKMIIRVNHMACEKLGYTEKELLAMKVMDVDNNSISEEETTSIWNKMVIGTPVTLATFHQRKDGSTFPVEVRASLIIHDQRKAVLGLARDISDRVAAEAALAESELKYRLLAENTFDWVYWISPQGKLVYNSPSCEHITGYSLEEFAQNLHLIENITHQDDSLMIRNHTKELLGDFHEEDIDFRIITKNGDLRWIRHSCRPVYTPDGIYAGRKAANKDITEKKETEYILQQQNEEFETLNEELRQSNEELYYLNAKQEELLAETQQQKFEIQQHNERLEGLLRVSQYQPTSRQDLLDYALREAIELTNSKIGYIYYYSEETKHFTLNSWSKGVMEECAVQDQQVEYDLEKTGCWGEAVRQRKPIIINDYKATNPLKRGTPTGHVQLHKFLTIPVVMQGEIVAVVGVANKMEDYDQTDVRQLTLLMDTVWRMAERESMIENLKRAKQEAEEADRLKSAFLANMSHEIRTPMNGILGFTNLLKVRALTPEKQQKYVGIIEKSGQRLLNIINDIIDFSKIESGTTVVKIGETNINELLKDIKSFFKLETEQKGIRLTHYNFLKTENAVIQTDKEKIYAILTNLVKNAIKFTSEGGIEVGYELKGQFLEFYVKDSGAGIPPEQKDIIFGRFRQGSESLNRSYEGAGLGLSISKAYVEMLGGQIWVESEVGLGSIFYFTIPFEGNSKKGMQNVDFENSNGYEGLNSRKLKIIIVEDDSFSAILLSDLIEPYASELLIATNGIEAVDLCKQHTNIDLILMDIKMPVMDGYEATREIRTFNKKVFIIAQTAFGLLTDREKAIAAGCNEYISKPIKQNLLIEMVNKAFPE